MSRKLARVLLILLLSPCVGVGHLAAEDAAGARAANKKSIPVICNALDRPVELSGIIGAPWRTDLLVAGTVTRVSEHVAHVQLETVYYGHAPGEVLPFRVTARHEAEPGRCILAFEARAHEGASAWGLIERVPARTIC